MEWLQILVLACLQGLTEFLPISSSAHLILVPVLTGWPDQGVAFDVAVHVGSLAAVSAVLPARFRRHACRRTAPAAGAGGGACAWGGSSSLRPYPWDWRAIAVDAGLSGALRDPLVIAAATIVFGLVLLVADRAGSKHRGIESLRVRDAVVIGCTQAIALIPGTSRSGITMTAGLFLGLQPEAAARFSFLLSAPVILLAGGYKSLQLVAGTSEAEWAGLAVGALVTAVCAYACIHAFLRLVDRVGFAPFVAYRLVLGAVLLWIFI